MNRVVLMGRLVADPQITYSNDKAVARYTLAVDRYKKDEADFIRCVAFDKRGEFVEKYFHKGLKVCVDGRIQTGSYTNKEGQTVYTTDVIVDNQEFAESKSSDHTQPQAQPQPTNDQNEFMEVDDSKLPF